MSVRMTPVILCGGSGTRLWPRSRIDRPKPFLPLVGQETLFEQTLLRCSHSEMFDPPIIVTGTRHLALVETQLWPAPDAQIIVEPEPKNTAAAIALAAARLSPDTIMLVCPSDHHIGKREEFLQATHDAAALAAQGWLVSIGIRPTRPDTGYGYIRCEAPVDGSGSGLAVAEFVEKPDSARAEHFVASEGYWWNGGIFALRVDHYLAELRTHRPALAELAESSVRLGTESGREFHPDAERFAIIDAESIDYAVMENTKRGAMISADLDWSDIGNWRALHQARERNADGNTVRGVGELIGCTDTLVETDGPRVHAIGVEGLIIVVDGNEVLIARASEADKVGKLPGAANQTSSVT